MFTYVCAKIDRRYMIMDTRRNVVIYCPPSFLSKQGKSVKALSDLAAKFNELNEVNVEEIAKYETRYDLYTPKGSR